MENAPREEESVASLLAHLVTKRMCTMTMPMPMTTTYIQDFVCFATQTGRLWIFARGRSGTYSVYLFFFGSHFILYSFFFFGFPHRGVAKMH